MSEYNHEQFLELKIGQTHHGERIKVLEDEAKVLGESLQGIKTNLTELKWLGYGLAAGLLMKETGILTFVKGLL